jgi:hypothetical protein
MIRYITIVSFLILGSCTTELNVELPFEGKKLVLWCVLSPDRVVSARVDHTYPPTGEFLYDAPITNANVELIENDKIIETLKYASDGIYLSAKQYKPVAGRSYKIRAKASGFPELESDIETIPLLPQVVSSGFEKQKNNQITVEIQDYKNQANQYSIQIIGTYGGKGVSINVTNLSRPDAISDNCGFRGNLNSFYYQDICFDGSTLKTNYSANLFGTVQELINGKLENKECDQIQILVKNISNSYFNFYKTIPPEDIDLAFKQPISKLYNLKGGYGLFASYNQRTLYYMNR